MPLPSSANVVAVKGYWWADDGTGAQGTVTATPAVDHVTSLDGHGVIDLAPKTAVPAEDGSWQIDVIASDDPDLTPVCAWTFTFTDYVGAWSVVVPHDAAAGEVWLTSLDHLVTPPTSSAAFYTRTQIDALFSAQDDDIEALEARVDALETLGPQA